MGLMLWHSSRSAPVAPGMATINAVLARVFVPDLEAAIPLYQALADVSTVSSSPVDPAQVDLVILG